MTPRRAIALVRGVGSFLTLVAVLVVPPIALTTLIGWPLPTAIPDLSSLGLTLRSGVSDELIVNILAVIAWLAWAQIAVAIIAELVAVVRGRPSIHLPVFPGIQATAARLVAGVVMTTATITPTAAMASPTPVIAAPAATTAPVDGAVLDLTAAPPAVHTADTAVVEVPVVAPTIIVDRHDSYWAIAERTLGNGYRWSEIRDLNVGRAMTTGHIVQAGSDLVHPGWILELPADAELVEHPATEAVPSIGGPSTADAADSTPPVDHAQVTVEEGDNFWALAEEQLATSTGRSPTAAETAPYWQDLIDANRDRLVEPHNPDLILPGQRLCVPPIAGTEAGGTGTEVEEPPTSTTEPAAAEVVEATPTVTPTSASGEDAESSDAGGHQLAPAPAAPTADTPPSVDQDPASDSMAPIAAGATSVALAAGVTLAIRRRRRRAAHRNPTRRPRPTSEKNRQLQSVLVAEGDTVAIEDLRRCLAGLAESIAHSGGDARPRVVQHADEYIGVYLDSPSPNAPPGWEVGGEGAVWSLEADSTEANPGDKDTCAAPLLVTLGQPDEGGQLYLDLEAAGVVALTGDDVAAHGVARAMLAELALTPLADTLQILVVGPALVPAEAESLDHVSLAESWDDAADNLTAWAEQSHNVLSVKGWPNAFVARGHDPDHDALAPVVVVASQPPPPRIRAILRANHPATLAVVAVGEIADATTVKCTPDSLSIPGIGLVCTPHPLAPETLAVIIDLLDEAEADSTDPLEGPTPTAIPELDGPGSELARSAEAEAVETSLPADVTGAAPITAQGCEESGIAPEMTREPEGSVLVRLLGEIRIDGGESLSPKQTAVVTYIALQGDVATERVQDALWASPKSGSLRKRLANTVSDCRSRISPLLLPAAPDSRYRAGPGLVTDLELFERRAGRAVGQCATDAVETLRSALDLVEGPLFTYRNADRDSYAWVDAENWVSTWELKVAAVAQECADLLLELERPDEAANVALHALCVIPTHTALTETLMRAHAANGHRHAAQRVYEEHGGALQTLGIDDPEESTKDLYDQLCRTP